jgi:hypothetical protein
MLSNTPFQAVWEFSYSKAYAMPSKPWRALYSHSFQLLAPQNQAPFMIKF